MINWLWMGIDPLIALLFMTRLTGRDEDANNVELCFGGERGLELVVY